MKKRILCLWLGAALMMSGLVSGCGDDLDSMAKSGPTPAKPAPAVTDKAPEEKKPDTEENADSATKSADYVYTSVGKRDPFRSPFEDLEADEIVGSEEDRVIGPLQTYDLSSFTVSGDHLGNHQPHGDGRGPGRQFLHRQSGNADRQKLG